MENKGLVSVVIPVYNAERFLREAVDTVLAQTYRNIEVITVNDGSADGSEQILKGYGDRIRYFRQENTGTAAARNRGLMEAKGEWIAFQDDDDLWHPQKLELQLRAAGADDTAVECRVRLVDETGRVIRDCYRSTPASAPSFADWLRDCRVSPSTIVRRQAVLDVGGLDSANRFGTDDYQLWLALVATGHRFRFIDDVLMSYRKHGRNLSGNLLRMYRGDIYALERTREKYPGAFGKVETEAYHKRLRNVHSAVAWWECDAGDNAGARSHFREALRHRPGSLKTWVFAVLSHIPFGLFALSGIRRQAIRRKWR